MTACLRSSYSTAPAVDPSWRTTEARGETLLAAVPRRWDGSTPGPSVIPDGHGQGRVGGAPVRVAPRRTRFEWVEWVEWVELG